MIGIDSVLKSEADGYTLAMVPSNMVMIPSMYDRVPDTSRVKFWIGLLIPYLRGAIPRAVPLTHLLSWRLAE